ncbi:GntR family transcriptional regulator [Brenneria goodwinii]|uniref:GntR family transcriptional regulator n=1 Tax=Brenneria goodwinii TaxID=1109412 RepID=UPI0036E42265
MLQHESISHKVYEQLKQQIISNQLSPGERLIVNNLSQRFGVSSIPVREALFRLAAEKLIVLEHNKGFKVAQKPDANNIFQWQQARLLIEPAIADMVLENITPNEIAHLRRLNDSMRTHHYGPRYEQYSYFINLNAEFHKHIVIASRNDLIIEMYGTLNYGPQVGRFHEEHGVPDLQLLCDEHDEIINAIEQRDADMYRSKSADHIILGFDRQISYSTSK